MAADRYYRREHREPPAIEGRVPPHDLDAEAAVLSPVLLGEGIDVVLEMLEGEDFYSDANRFVFEAAANVHAAGKPVDLVTVKEWLDGREQLHQVGGTGYLLQLAEATPAVANLAHHCKIVRDKKTQRRIIAIAHKYAAEGYGRVEDVAEWADAFEAEVHEQTMRSAEAKGGLVKLKTILVDTFEQMKATAGAGGRITGTPTGYVDLDKKIAGLHAGDLMIVAARPGMGKTSLILNVATNVASPTTDTVSLDEWRTEEAERPGEGVVVFQLEMPKEQVATRMLCTEARVDLGKLRQGWLSNADWANLTAAGSAIADLPIWIEDTPGLTVLQARGRIRRLQAEVAKGRHGEVRKVGLVIIDYLQLMRGSGKPASREQEIAEISRDLKNLSKELGVPVIALSQLNRGVETRGRGDKRPGLSDLRESGSLEQDADVVIFVYRDEYYDKEKTDAKGIAELIVAKQRNGPTGTVRVRFISSCTKFENLAPGEWEEFDELGS